MRTFLLSLLSIGLGVVSSNAQMSWPQFRGPGGLGIGTGSPPIEFNAEKEVVWKVAVPRGHSSPCIAGGKIFLTGQEGEKLVTLCLDQASGKELWRAAAPAAKLESTHRIGSPAAPTPCTDGERVFVYFGSFGMIAYDFDGREVWKKELPAPLVEFGTGASPILADGKIIVVADQDMGSHLLALDARTGSQVWRTEREEFRRSFSTPFLWAHDGMAEIIVAGSLWVRSYEVKDGRERWSSRGMARVSNASPVAGDGLLLVSSWNVGGDEGDRVKMEPFAPFAATYDTDKDGTLNHDEFPAGKVKDRFSQMDANKDGRVTRAEYEVMSDMFDQAVNQIFAIKPNGYGDITETHVAWKVDKHLPYVSSPLFYEGRVYTIKNGGLASCYDAKTGALRYQAERMDAAGDYYSSAVAADGRIYVASQRGTVVVIAAGDALKILARNDLREPIFATPALVEGRLYVRTEKHLFVFGQ